MIIACFRNYRKFSQLKGQRESPEFFNPNISLISSIGMARDIPQLLSLHQLLANKFTPKHLGHSARKFIQLAKWSSSNRQLHKLPLISLNHVQSLNNFLLALRQADLSSLSGEQLISFAIFLQKIGNFKSQLISANKQIERLESELKKRLVAQIDQNILQELNFQQVCSLFNATKDFMTAQLEEKILQYIHKQLLENPYCTCFHLVLLCKQLQSRKESHKKLIGDIQDLCFTLAIKQLHQIKKYIHPRSLIQFYNSFYATNNQDVAFLLSIIKEKLRNINNRDTSTYAIFFQHHLRDFEQNLKNHVGVQQSLKTELNRLFEEGRKIHSRRHSQFAGQQKETSTKRVNFRLKRKEKA